MGASKFFNGITRLLTTKRGSSGTASKREATLNKRGRLSSNYCGICTPNMEDNTHTPPPYRGTELAMPVAYLRDRVGGLPYDFFHIDNQFQKEATHSL